jgi:hypothetical protein
MAKSAFDDFIIVLQRYRKLIVWCTSVSVALPLAADKIDLTPPWPKGIVLTSAILQLVCAVVTFQLMGRSGRRVISRFLVAGMCGLLVTGAIYLAALSQLTFYGGPAKERLVKGLQCTDAALSLPDYAKTCPLLNDGLIAGAEKADELWTPTSITASRLVLLGLWCATLLMLSGTLVAFVVFSSQQTPRIATSRSRAGKH